MTEVDTRAAVDKVYRDEGGRVRASLMRVVRDLDKTEDALQEAIARALVRWPVDGVPDKPGAWLMTTARNHLIDQLRKKKTHGDKEAAVIQHLDTPSPGVEVELSQVRDDELKLFFMCCHPALNVEAQVALTLHTLGGLRTDEIARAFMVPRVTMSQRLVRAKKKIKAAGIPFALPPDQQLAERTEVVLAVIYLVFNEGYATTDGDALVRHDLSNHAIRLGALVTEMLPQSAEALGLLALMLLHDSRRGARSDDDGDLVLLEDQDRSSWDRDQIDEGKRLLERGLRLGQVGPYQLQAAISAVHASAATPDATDWRQIVGLYEALARVHPSPVVELNRAAAVAMADGPEAGLALMEELRAPLEGHHLLHAARADLLRRTGALDQAHAAYKTALDLATNLAERRFLERRLADCAPTR